MFPELGFQRFRCNSYLITIKLEAIDDMYILPLRFQQSMCITVFPLVGGATIAICFSDDQTNIPPSRCNGKQKLDFANSDHALLICSWCLAEGV